MRTWTSQRLLLMCAVSSYGLFGPSDPAAAERIDVPVTLGAPQHTWDTLTGGATWLFSRQTLRAHASLLGEYPGSFLIDVKRNMQGFGYRFDLDSWDPSTAEFHWFAWDGSDAGEPANLDETFQILGQPNVKFIFNLPMPRPGTGGFGWQTPEFYAAECQYLFGSAGPPSQYAGLKAQMDFFATPASFNWANLRARRGRIEPYPVQAIILGEEPYFIENWDQDGAAFGARAEEYRRAIRARGVDVPYGVHGTQVPATDRERTWFHPMLDALDRADPPRYLDLFHYYSYHGADDWERSFPVALAEEGFQNWWVSRSTWRADYTRFLWTVEDTRRALAERGIGPDSMSLGWTEHGITTTSQFEFNDMKGALHWAAWLAETMRYGTDFDAMWVFGAEGFSTALVQYRNGVLTRTPAFYAYQIARKLQGLTVLDAQYASPLGDTVTVDNRAVRFPWLVVRVLEDPATRARHLFVVNQHPRDSFTLTGLPYASIETWEELSAPSYGAGTPLGVAAPEIVRAVVLPKPPDAPLTVPPISVTHIVLR